jgi:hypothetical protein
MYPVRVKNCEKDKNNQCNKIKQVFRNIFPKIRTDLLLAPRGPSIYQVRRNESTINLNKQGASYKYLFNKNTNCCIKISKKAYKT